MGHTNILLIEMRMFLKNHILKETQHLTVKRSRKIIKLIKCQKRMNMVHVQNMSTLHRVSKNTIVIYIL